MVVLDSIGDFHTHFLNKHASAGCKLGWKDYDRFLYFIRLLFEINLIGIYTGIFVVFAFSFIYLSNLLFVATIYSLIYRIYKDAHRDTDFLTSVEWIYTILKMTIFGLVGVFVGIPVALSTGFFVGIPIVILYMGIVYIKTNPASRLASSEELLEKFLTYVKWMGRLFGMGLYGRMVDAARKEKKHKKEVAEQRKLVEASERAVRVYKDDFRKERFGDQVFIVNEQNPDQESATNQTPETGNATTPLETSKELNELAIDTAKNRVQSDKQSASNEIDEGDADQSEFGTDANTPGKDKGKKKDDKKSKGKEEGKSKDKKGRKHSKAENNNKKKGADQKKKSDKPEKKESDKPSKATKKDKPRPQQKPKKSSKGPTTSKSKRSSGNKAKKPSKGKK
ncbi:hypothetical protein WR25_17196 [Diploscapter pachys]|uniref:Uncharacterized protein n=1 Tax=Diploscapter pachys TaxID=2018661 RepID=A0A2A2KIP2_9BILA|nr:hypothetical protein WR25_17196 [Diploscapter pachys]